MVSTLPATAPHISGLIHCGIDIGEPSCDLGKQRRRFQRRNQVRRPASPPYVRDPAAGGGFGRGGSSRGTTLAGPESALYWTLVQLPRHHDAVEAWSATRGGVLQ